ncbi:MAG: hypothetical protein WKF78_05640 [Candidatus Limnocylindrales bacterium]
MADPVVVAILWLGGRRDHSGFLLAPLGVVLDAAIIVALALWSREGGRTASVAAVLILVPLLRILWVGLAMDGVPPLDASPTIALVFLAATWLTARAIGLDRHGIGLVRPTGFAPRVRS